MKSAEIKKCELKLTSLAKSIKAKEQDLAAKEEEIRNSRKEYKELTTQIKAYNVNRARIQDEMEGIFISKNKHVSFNF